MSEPVKLSVVYYSSTGNIAEIANALVAEAEAAGAEVRLRRAPELAPDAAVDSNPAWRAHLEATRSVPEVTAEDVVWADAVLFGSPTRYGNIAAQLKQFIDSLGGEWQQGLLADKAYSGFTSSATQHGGQESTLLALYNSIHHFGGIIVSPGYTDGSKFVDGNPYGTSHVDAQGEIKVGEQTRTAAAVQAKRVVRVAAALKGAA
ncbi:NAD(P)H dehydrogenase (quinone) [Saccharopolyspora lacisalsi]|uniref:NAD(P)H dehydrogenase (Quinone) n=1 Tax=Halosaccharopolyspora lacisalsi TaxID=1000566 RepID=A0A839DVY8_9PSEU|nr:NAD(P)H:quinone oxidoreductase [Halosaccharopolyspora lacisalsi]MBA8822958.1 NAD(P)H dehydrogenase (quinone) [Halosaccharopolyspora lacisalsi]